MGQPIPYFRQVAAAVTSAALLAFLLNLALRDWMASLHLATVAVFTMLTLILMVRAAVIAIIKWRRGKDDDPPGRQEDFGLAA
jgi:hypothetical protein